MAGTPSKGKPQQRSITAFFGAAPAKRKAAEETDEPPTKKPASPIKNASPKKKTVKKTQEAENENEKPQAKKRKIAATRKQDKEEEEEEDVAMEEVEEKVVASKSKPGRRRLRQRIVEDDEFSEDDAMEALNMKKTTKKTNEIVEIDSDGDENDDEEKAAAPVVAVAEPEEEEKPTDLATTELKDEAMEQQPEEKEEEAEEDAEEEAEVEDAEEVEEQPTKPTKKESAAASSFFGGTTTNKPTKSTNKPTEPTKKANTDTSVGPLSTDDNATGVPYTSLAALFSEIESSSSRLVIQDLLMNFFRQVIQQSPQDLLACIYLCVCTDLAPPFDNLKIGIGDAILMKAIGEATGSTPKFIKDMYQKEGDLGKVAQNSRSKQNTLSFGASKPQPASVLSVPDVYNQFVKIAKMTGNNSQAQKCSIIKNLLVKCEKDKKATGQKSEQAAEAAKYIIRGLQGKLRIGLAEKSILMGLTYAFMLEKDAKDKEKQEKALACVKRAFAECPSYNALVAAFQTVQQSVSTSPSLKVADFEEVAKQCVLTPGTPVSPMLARPTKAYAMVFDRFQGMPFTCEYKYDGERAQIHILENGEMAIFSRNFENSTERFPDVKLMIAKSVKKKATVTSCIVDAEVVAVDRASNKRLPFQVLSTRSRKNVKVEDIKVPVCIYAFDLLFLNGESLLQVPLNKRRELLREHFEVEDGSFEFATSMDVDGVVPGADDAEALEVAVDKVRTFLEEAVRENCEGLMVKTLEKEATYEPANRSHKWLKLKKDYLDGIGDSTDLVPIGAFHGRGKRTGVYGAYLLACYDPETEMYQPITKLGTGLNDEQLKDFHAQLKERVTEKPHRDYAITDAIKPDVWFEPSVVWEILGADLSISPKYTAGIGLVAKDKGISLRFPRFIRIRDDKDTTQATSSSQIADLYRAQGLATVTGADDDEDNDMLI